jgi:hypothetical protein
MPIIKHNPITTDEPMFRVKSGTYINVLKPDPNDFHINDIANGLSKTYRFNNHAQVDYTVAEHSMWVAKKVWEETQDKQLTLTALMHDAAEAYLCDIPHPIKQLLPDYKKIELSFEEAISKKFNLNFPFPSIIKKYDWDAVVWEWEHVATDAKITPLNSDKAFKYFIIEFYKYYEV